MGMVRLRRYWFVTARDTTQKCLVSPRRVPPWAELSLFPWRAQTASRVNDVIAGCAVQCAPWYLLQCLSTITRLQVLARYCSESSASRVD